MDSPQAPTGSAVPDRLARLLDYLASDPHNRNLLGDAATAAFDAQRFALCDELLARREALGPLPEALLNLRGLSAMARHRLADALAIFQSLSAERADPVVHYNIAYAHAMLGHFEEALAQLTDPVLVTVPAAIALKLQCLHHLGRLDDVIELGSRHADDPRVGPEVCGLLATALFDAEDIDGAQRYAARAGTTADGLTVQGLLALDDASPAEAMGLFAHALLLRPGHTRAHLGVGLALLAQEHFAEAAQEIDIAAALFGTHAGSWIAAGWAHLLEGNLAQARARFEEAGRVDRGFAEAPGGLAVVDVREGKLDHAKRRVEIALRLDPACLSAALAQSLIAATAGDPTAANAIRDAALHRPLGSHGKTLAQLLSRRAARGEPKTARSQ